MVFGVGRKIKPGKGWKCNFRQVLSSALGRSWHLNKDPKDLWGECVPGREKHSAKALRQERAWPDEECQRGRVKAGQTVGPLLGPGLSFGSDGRLTTLAAEWRRHRRGQTEQGNWLGGCYWDPRET